jgi:two-component system sensor histidine kinase FlrB
MKRVCDTAPTATSQQELLEELAERFQAASSSLERTYAELKDRVATLSNELAQEREERIRLERMAAMGEMAMELAHEIRNPLGSIELYASMTDGEHAAQIVRSVRLLNHTVSNILHFGSAVRPVPARVHYRELLDGVASLLGPIAAQKRIEVVVACDNDCAGNADFELLHRMLVNLVLNALRETPAGGEIRLTAIREENHIALVVKDTGPGIPAEHLERIFDPLFSTSQKGNGLGLPIVRQIVESHNGTIDVMASHQGTAFLICLPHTGGAGDEVKNVMEVASGSPLGS